MNKFLEAALANAARGFRVFPLLPGSKKPAIKGWTDRATSDPEEIRALWGDQPYNVGVLTDGMIVVDIDNKNGKNGSASFKALGLTEDERSTYVTQTASGGYHAYYKGPDRSLSVGRLGDGLDIRSYHGYVVGAGSEMVSDLDSSVTVDGPIVVLVDRELRDVPSSLLARLDAPRERDATPVHSLDSDAQVQAVTAYLETAAPAVEGRGGDQRTYQVAARAKDLGVSEALCLDLMLDHWNERCDPPWEPEELKAKVENAYRYGTSAPGSQAPEVKFADVKRVLPPSRSKRSWGYQGDEESFDQQWLLHSVAPATGVLLLVGPSQGGKTFLLGEMARCIASGEPFFGVEPEDKGGVAFCFAGTEGSGFGLRMKAWDNKPRSLPVAYTSVGNLSQTGALDALYEDLKAQSEMFELAYDVPLRMVVLETLSASGLVSDENDNAGVAQAMSNLGQLSKALGCLVVITHHPPKKGEGGRGAGAFYDNADYVMEIFRNGQDQVRKVELTKARNAEQRSLGGFTLVPVIVGYDSKDRPVVTLKVSLSTGKLAGSQLVLHEKAELLLHAFEDVFPAEPEVERVEYEGRPAYAYKAVQAKFYELIGQARSSSSTKSTSWKRYAESGPLAQGLIEEVLIEGRSYLRRKS